MDKVIETLKEGVPEALTELRALGRTLCERRSDILAYFDHPHTSNGPTQATGGRPGRLRGHRTRPCATSPTTPPAVSCTPGDSETSSYTLKPEEPERLIE